MICEVRSVKMGVPCLPHSKYRFSCSSCRLQFTAHMFGTGGQDGQCGWSPHPSNHCSFAWNREMRCWGCWHDSTGSTHGRFAAGVRRKNVSHHLLCTNLAMSTKPVMYSVVTEYCIFNFLNPQNCLPNKYAGCPISSSVSLSRCVKANVDDCTAGDWLWAEIHSFTVSSF